MVETANKGEASEVTRAMPLLVTKLYIPPARPGLAARPRLMDRLNAGLAARLVLVSAPAGAGKTTLLSAWRATPQVSDIPFAWLSLDEGDNDPARFWAYVIAALQGVQAGVGEATLALLRSPQTPPVELTMTSLINEVSQLKPDFILVLDDYHVIQSEYIHGCLTFLLDHQPPQMRLVIASREYPPLPLARLRGRGHLVEVREADLRFTPQEAAEFLNQVMRLDLSMAQVAALVARTEGWIAGLQMISLSLQGRRLREGRPDVSGATATIGAVAWGDGERQVADYLVTEALRYQPDPIKTFVLHTSVLNRLCGPLCEALTGQPAGQAMLQRLEATNLFTVPLDDKGDWYRYHHLFAETLRRQLAQTAPERVGELHRRASVWYEQHDFTVEAIEHALAAQDFATVARLIEETYRLAYKGGQLTDVQRWLEALPDDFVRSRPQLCVIYALNIEQTTLDLAAMKAYLDAAEQALSQMEDSAETRRQRGLVAAGRVNVAAWYGDVSQAEAQYRLAGDLLPAGESRRHGTTLRLGLAYLISGDALAADRLYMEVGQQTDLVALASPSWAAVCLSRGQLHRAMNILRAGMEFTRQTRPHLLQTPLISVGILYNYIGMILYEWNDLATALSYFLAGLDVFRLWQRLDDMAWSYEWITRVYLAQGERDKAAETAEQFEYVARRLDPSRSRSYFSLWRAGHISATEAHLQLAQGNLAAANRWAVGSGLTADDAPTYPHAHDHLIWARVRLAQGRADETVGLLTRLADLAETQGRMGDHIMGLVLHALALQAQGAMTQALDMLQLSLALAEPEGYIRVFVDEGTPMAALLSTLIDEPTAANLRPYIGKLLAAFPQREVEPVTTTASHTPPPQPLIEPLSGRELEVLRLMATGLSNQAMAAKLHITVGTVKTHVNAIFGKLDAHNRTLAVARARTFKLLED